MGDIEENNPPSFAVALNSELLSKATKIKKTRDAVKERLEKLEKSKKTASERVFKKVQAEYIEGLDKATAEMVAVKSEIDQEIENIQEQKMLAELALRDSKDDLEEKQLREDLGEISEEEFKKIERERLAVIERLKREIKALDDNVEKYASLFKAEELFVSPDKMNLPPPEAAEGPKPSKPAPKPKKETKKSVIEESDYVYLPDDLDAAKEEKDDLLSEAPADESPYSEELSPQLIVKEGGTIKEEMNLGEETFFIGRSPTNQLTLADPKVSRKHATIDFKGGNYVISDMGSSNGTFVGGKKIKEQILKSGDEIKIGSYTLIFKS